VGHALAHLRRRLVGEGDGEDAAGIDTTRDEVGDPRRDDTGLARARPGQDQQRSLDGGDGVALRRIERREQRGYFFDGACTDWM
jgi:hypothetical protein